MIKKLEQRKKWFLNKSTEIEKFKESRIYEFYTFINHPNISFFLFKYFEKFYL